MCAHQDFKATTDPTTDELVAIGHMLACWESSMLVRMVAWSDRKLWVELESTTAMRMISRMTTANYIVELLRIPVSA